MKKKYTAVALALVAAMALTGCSLDDVKEKFIGTQTATNQTVTGGSVEIEDYSPEQCVSLGEYKGVEVDCTVSDDEVQSEIDTLLNHNISYKELKKGTAATGMDVNIDYIGKVDGKKFDGGSAEDQMIELGNSGYIPGFDDGVTGMKVGETKDLNLQFPDDYEMDASLAGKKVVFTVTLNYIAQEQRPEFNDKFVAANTDYKTVDEYREKTKKKLADDKKASVGTTAFSKVLESSKVIEIPATLKEAQKLQIKTFTGNQVAAYGMDVETYLSQIGMTQEQYESQLETSAEDNALMLLVIEAIAAKENISCTEEERKAAIEKTVSNAGISEEDYRSQYKSYYGDAFSFDEFIRQSVLYDKVLELIEKNAVIKE